MAKKISFWLTLCTILTLSGTVGHASPQTAITLDGIAAPGEWDLAWRVTTDPLDVYLTDTGVHPNEAPTYARSGYDAIGLWAHYQANDDHWYFRLDVDGRAGDSDSQYGTAGALGVGTHGNDGGPLVMLPFTDGAGLGNLERYKLGFNYSEYREGIVTSLGPGFDILPGVIATTTGDLSGQAIYSTTIPGIIEWSFPRTEILPAGSSHSELWISALLGDVTDRVSDDMTQLTLLIAQEITGLCSEAPILVGEPATFAFDYHVDPDSSMPGISDAKIMLEKPPGTTFISASDGGKETETGDAILWEPGDLSSGIAKQVTLTLSIDDPMSSIDLLSEMTSAEGLRSLDTTVCPVFEPPNLSINKTVIPEIDVPIHSPLTYTIALHNSGQIDAVDVLLTDTLPTTVQFAGWVPRNQPDGASVADNELTWKGAVSTTETVTFTFVVTHTGSFGDIVTNSAVYSHSTGDGSDSATFTVKPGFPIYLPWMINNPDYQGPIVPFSR
jgi:uncharacterized repeat protein (TIGR01451 family)